MRIKTQPNKTSTATFLATFASTQSFKCLICFCVLHINLQTIPTHTQTHSAQMCVRISLCCAICSMCVVLNLVHTRIRILCVSGISACVCACWYAQIYSTDLIQRSQLCESKPSQNVPLDVAVCLCKHHTFTFVRTPLLSKQWYTVFQIKAARFLLFSMANSIHTHAREIFVHSFTKSSLTHWLHPATALAIIIVVVVIIVVVFVLAPVDTMPCVGYTHESGERARVHTLIL